MNRVFIKNISRHSYIKMNLNTNTWMSIGLLEMIYPDEEKITYFYNLGGQLEKVHGYKSYGYDYVSKIGYDKFEQRTREVRNRTDFFILTSAEHLDGVKMKGDISGLKSLLFDKSILVISWLLP